MAVLMLLPNAVSVSKSSPNTLMASSALTPASSSLKRICIG